MSWSIYPIDARGRTPWELPFQAEALGFACGSFSLAVSFAVAATQLGLGLVGSSSSPSQAAMHAEQAERVRKALEMLKESDREILWLRHNDDLTFPEAAYVLEISESAATLRYWRALKRFKELWQKLYPDESRP